MLWVFYIVDTYRKLGYEGPLWLAVFCLAALAACVIPVIAMAVLVSEWGTLSPRKKLHLAMAILFY